MQCVCKMFPRCNLIKFGCDVLIELESLTQQTSSDKNIIAKIFLDTKLGLSNGQQQNKIELYIPNLIKSFASIHS